MFDEKNADEMRDERREYDRSRLIVDVHFDGGDATGIASTKDIGIGGLYMNTRTAIPEGTRLKLRVPLAAQPVVIDAEVVYSQPGHGVGVRFQDLTDEARNRIEQLLAEPINF